MWGHPNPRYFKKGEFFMNELLFFVLGFVIGGLSGLTTMCVIQINKLTNKSNINYDDYREDDICEQEK